MSQPLGLTATQARILEVIREAVARNGISPSYREIRQLTGIKSQSHVSQIIKRLEQRGFIIRRPGSERSIALTHSAHACPYCGHVIEKARAA